MTRRPGVTVEQVAKPAASSVADPQLIPCIVGPCYEIIKPLLADGSINDASKLSSLYNQAAVSIQQGSFPNPRGNINELNIDDAEVKLHMYKFSKLQSIARGSNLTKGTSFLGRVSSIHRPAVLLDLSDSANSAGALDALTLVIAIDVVAASVASTIITFSTEETTSTLIAATINAAMPYTVAYVDSNDKVIIASPNYGPAASVTIRTGADATELLSSAFSGNSTTYRVEGPGLAAQDDTDGDEVSPYIEHVAGIYYANGTVDTHIAATGRYIDGVFTQGGGQSVTFGDGKDIPMKAATAISAGDVLIANGNIVGGEITLVEENRFRVGSLNVPASTASGGVYTNRVYDTVEVNVKTHDIPFSPKYAYFQAQNLVYGEVSPAGVSAALVAAPSSPILARKGFISIDVSGTLNEFLNGADVAMNGLNLVVQETVAGVQQDEETITYIGAPGNLTDLASAIAGNEGTTLGASADGNYLVLSTGQTGKGNSIVVKTLGTLNAKLEIANALTCEGKDDELAVRASYTGGTTSLFSTLQNETLTISVTDSTDTLTESLSIIGTPSDITATIATVIAAFGDGSSASAIILEGVHVAELTESSGKLVFTTVEGGLGVTIAVSSADGTPQLGIAGGVTIAGANTLKDTTLDIELDENPTVYECNFVTNSVQDAVDVINQVVGGTFPVASNEDGAITLTSTIASSASVITLDSTDSGYISLEFAGDTAGGTGRPNPDFYIDPLTSAVVVGANIIRSTSTGIPNASASVNAPMYLEYKALRLDVTASASKPGIVNITADTLEAIIGPVSEDNPVALGAYLALLNSPSAAVTILGIDEVTDAAPEGTIDGYLRAITLLASKEVYAIATLTGSAFVNNLMSAHATELAKPESRGERIVFSWLPTPDRASDSLIEGGDGDALIAGTNIITLTGVNIQAGVTSAGIDPTDASASDGLFIELVAVSLGSSSVLRYSVVSVNNETVTLRSTFAAGENDDGFYTESALLTTSGFTLTFTAKVRGDKLLITGTTLPDVAAIASTVAGQGTAIGNRRIFLGFASSADTVLDGIVTNVPGYYLSAATAGMVGGVLASQPHTNVTINGFSKVYGTDDTYSDSTLDIVADGGRFIFVNNGGGGVTCRHQRSTDNSTMPSRELSITKAIDFIAKGIRAVNRSVIGSNNITSNLVMALTLSNSAYLRRQEGVIVKKGTLDKIAQSTSNLDRIEAEVSLDVFAPCNNIDFKIIS